MKCDFRSYRISNCYSSFHQMKSYRISNSCSDLWMSIYPFMSLGLSFIFIMHRLYAVSFGFIFFFETWIFSSVSRSKKVATKKKKTLEMRTHGIFMLWGISLFVTIASITCVFRTRKEFPSCNFWNKTQAISLHNRLIEHISCFVMPFLKSDYVK